jgi:hypothetical protein
MAMVFRCDTCQRVAPKGEFVPYQLNTDRDIVTAAWSGAKMRGRCQRCGQTVDLEPEFPTISKADAMDMIRLAAGQKPQKSNGGAGAARAAILGPNGKPLLS